MQKGIAYITHFMTYSAALLVTHSN